VANHLGWQAACFGLLLTRRDAGLKTPAALNPEIVMLEAERSGHALL